MNPLTDENGNVIATWYKRLKLGECACKYDRYPQYIVKDRVVYRKKK